MENKIKYDKLNVSKNSRKKLKKKASDEDYELSDMVPKKKKKKNSLIEKKQNMEILEKSTKQKVCNFKN